MQEGEATPRVRSFFAYLNSFYISRLIDSHRSFCVPLPPRNGVTTSFRLRLRILQRTPVLTFDIGLRFSFSFFLLNRFKVERIGAKVITSVPSRPSRSRMDNRRTTRAQRDRRRRRRRRRNQKYFNLTIVKYLKDKLELSFFLGCDFLFFFCDAFPLLG